MTEVVDAAEIAKPIIELARQLEVQTARANYWKAKHAHLRRRVRELVRMLPVDLPVPACNFRLIVVALVTAGTEFIELSEEPREPAPEHDSGGSR